MGKNPNYHNKALPISRSPSPSPNEKERNGHVFCAESAKCYDTLFRDFQSQSPATPASDSKNHNNHNKVLNLSEVLMCSPSPMKGLRKNLSAEFFATKSPLIERAKEKIKKNMSEDESTEKKEKEDEKENDIITTPRKAFDFSD